MAFRFRRAPERGPPPPSSFPAPPPPTASLRQTSSLNALIQSALSRYISRDSMVENSMPDTDQEVQKGSLIAVARSIKKCVSGMSRWDITDLTLGLYKIATRHAVEGVSDTIHGHVVSEKQELEEILYWLEWAWASYLAEEKAIIEYLHIEEQQLKKHVNTSAILQPAYFIAIDNAKKCIVLSIRGTYAATDVLTDLQPHSEKFEGGFAHSGILSAARWILENECSKLQILLSDNPGYKLVLTGHSLGAGAACLLSYLFHESVGCGNKEISSRLGISSTMIECWGFGCPPCVDEQLCQNSMFIKNVVLQDDIVTRACVAALEDLRTEILQTNWDDVLEDGGAAKKLLNLVNSTNAALGHADRALGYTQGTLYQKLKSASYAAFVSSFRASVSGNRQPGPLYNFPPAQFGISQPYGPRGYAEAHHSYNPGGYHGAPNHCGPSSFSPCNMEGTPPGSLPGLVAIGSSILSSYLNTPGSDSMDTVLIDGESMVNGRLFVPGILFHIKRSQVETGRERGRASAKEVRVESDSPGSDTGSAPISMRHYVIKGWDPRGIIMKIVLSKSLLSDHSLVSYRDAIKDAIRWNQIVE